MRTIAAALALSSLFVAANAAALCEPDARDPSAPARIGFGPAGFGSLPEACPATEIALQGDATILVATEEFYGSIAAGATVRGRYALGDRVWVSAWAPGPSYFYVANATVDASSVDLGASALGVHVSLPFFGGGRFAPFARALVPTETIYQHAVRYGFDHGFTTAFRALERLEILSGMSFPLLLTDGSGTVHASFGPLLRAEASFTPFRYLQANAGFSLRFRGGDDATFESFEPLFGVRVLPIAPLRLELAVRVPLAGHDRTDVGATFNAGWTFGR